MRVTQSDHCSDTNKSNTATRLLKQLLLHHKEQAYITSTDLLASIDWTLRLCFKPIAHLVWPVSSQQNWKRRKRRALKIKRALEWYRLKQQQGTCSRNTSVAASDVYSKPHPLSPSPSSPADSDLPPSDTRPEASGASQNIPGFLLTLQHKPRKISRVNDIQ